MELHKPLLESDVSSIIEVRRYFDEPIKELRKNLDALIIVQIIIV